MATTGLLPGRSSSHWPACRMATRPTAAGKDLGGCKIRKEVDWPSLGQPSSSGPINYSLRVETLAWLPTQQALSLLTEVQVSTLGCGHGRGREVV